MGERILADTNCIIDYLNNTLSAKSIYSLQNFQIELSVINRIELLAWQAALSEEIILIQNFINDCFIHNLSEEIIVKTIDVRRDFGLKLPDAIIAATALAHNLTLYSRNLTDFKKVPGLEVINPHLL
jgi:predicted nucleic acid-binding protein